MKGRVGTHPQSRQQKAAAHPANVCSVAAVPGTPPPATDDFAEAPGVDPEDETSEVASGGHTDNEDGIVEGFDWLAEEDEEYEEAKPLEPQELVVQLLISTRLERTLTARHMCIAMYHRAPLWPAET